MPPDTARLTFREMTPADLDDMAALLGDPDVMTYYPRPKTRPEAAQWIDWNPLFPREWSDRIGEFFAAAELTWLDGAGHFSPLEAPGPFAAAVTAAITG